ncbi:hypothetical protein NEF87_004927 [Candidatus Lokiarchaeum ossiferum]|uniref:SDR family oxidoreductase n=1 Tax=Candidatus Lokiarchaeum ossiferum TaxID=2951803 RepID=A0ABY6I0J5_9ARCH|nr:hypothetical protein NEF87_004927 [Candidatus Lokiarchaeum sp. B-35]
MVKKSNFNLKKYKLAVITGASSGIGLEFAKQFAENKINLILIARRVEKLEEICLDLEKQYHIKATYIKADLTLENDVKSCINQLDQTKGIDILVNGAGFGTIGGFTSVSLEAHFQMIQLHINAVVHLCHAILPQMQQNNKGIVINIASLGAFTPTRGNSVYSASKSFLITFFENLQKELDKTEIILQALCPGFTRTEFHEVGHFSDFDRSRIPTRLWMTVKDVVAISLAALKKKSLIVIPGRKNKWIYRLYRSPIVQFYMKKRRKKGSKKGSKKNSTK